MIITVVISILINYKLEMQYFHTFSLYWIVREAW